MSIFFIRPRISESLSVRWQMISLSDMMSFALMFRNWMSLGKAEPPKWLCVFLLRI